MLGILGLAVRAHGTPFSNIGDGECPYGLEWPLQTLLRPQVLMSFLLELTMQRRFDTKASSLDIRVVAARVVRCYPDMVNNEQWQHIEHSF